MSPTIDAPVDRVDPPARGRARPPRWSRSELAALAAVIGLAALVRFWRLGHQSLWLDESFTVELLRRPLGGLLSQVSETESTPPLYYLLSWAWAKAFGTGEAALRSLSAIVGTLAVPAAWRAARDFFSPRAAIMAAALIAVNPFLVWYGQEARAYALLVALAALSLAALARCLRDPRPRCFALWALVAVLAVGTHYFAGFLVFAEAVWLVAVAAPGRSRRAALAAVGALAAASLALLPLALHQRVSGKTGFIAEVALAQRLQELPKKLVTGPLGTPLPALGAAAGVLVVVGVALALTRLAPAARRTAACVVGLAAAAAGAPFVLALAGFDFFLDRNVITAFVALLLVVAAGYATPRLRRAGPVLVAALCFTGLVVDAEVAYDRDLQRDDWRGAGAALGAAREPRAIVLTPAVQRKPFELYAGRTRPLAPADPPVREVSLVEEGRPPSRAIPAPPPGFQSTERKRAPSWRLIRYRSPVPRPVAPAALAALAGGKPAIALLQSPR